MNEIDERYREKPDPAAQLREIMGGARGASTTTKKPQAGRMKTQAEIEYGEQLEARKQAGEILWYAYEPITWKLAEKTTYTPDYLVQLADGSLECHEVKGAHVWEDSRIKIKVAAKMFPVVRFVWAQKKNRKWTIKEIPA